MNTLALVIGYVVIGLTACVLAVHLVYSTIYSVMAGLVLPVLVLRGNGDSWRKIVSYWRFFPCRWAREFWQHVICCEGVPESHTWGNVTYKPLFGFTLHPRITEMTGTSRRTPTPAPEEGARDEE